MQSPLPYRIRCREIDDEHLSLFSTTEFHAFIKELLQMNSLAGLFSFIVSTHGVNKVSRENPYIFILYENLRPTHRTYNMLAHAKSGHYIKAWGTEIFTRVLAKIPLTEEQRMSAKLPLIATHLAERLYTTYKLNKVCTIYDSKFLDYVSKTIAHEFEGNSLQHRIDAQTIVQAGNEIVSDMQKYFAKNRRHKYCTLLTFFGADFHTNPTTTSPTALKEVLLSSKVVAHIANGNISPAETSCRNGIFAALSTAITGITSKLEEEEIFASKVFAWYHVVKKLRQLVCKYITIPALNRSVHIVKLLDTGYRKSICFGDCTDFFVLFEDVKNNFTGGNDQYIQHLFSALGTMQRSYVVMPHSELATEIRNCSTGHTPLRVAPVCTSLTAKLQKTGHKISAGAVSLHNTTILETNAFLQNIRKKLCKSKGDSQKRPCNTAGYHGSTLSTYPSKKSASLEDINPVNDNLATFTSCHKRKTVSWRRHLLKRAGKLLGVKQNKRRPTTTTKCSYQDNSTSDMNKMPASAATKTHTEFYKAKQIVQDNNPFTATEATELVALIKNKAASKLRKSLHISSGKSGKKLHDSDILTAHGNAATQSQKN